MNRCILCDYVPNHGSDYTLRGPVGWNNRIKWNDKERGYVCNECEQAIHLAKEDYDHKDDEEEQAY